MIRFRETRSLRREEERLLNTEDMLTVFMHKPGDVAAQFVILPLQPLFLEFFFVLLKISFPSLGPLLNLLPYFTP